MDATVLTEDLKIRPQTRGSDGMTRFWDIFLRGRFIMGSKSRDCAERLRDQLVANELRFLDCYETAHPSPLAFIGHVREEKWTFEESSRLERLEDGRCFFSGNLVECSSAFRYLILDKELLAEVQRQVPEIKYGRY